MAVVKASEMVYAFERSYCSFYYIMIGKDL